MAVSVVERTTKWREPNRKTAMLRRLELSLRYILLGRNYKVIGVEEKICVNKSFTICIHF